jgi:hypothetical protein
VKACIGAVGSERRTQAVRIAESATARSAGVTEGEGLDQAAQRRQRPLGVFLGRPLRDRWEGRPLRVEQQARGRVVAGICQDRTVRAERRRVDDAGEHRQPPVADAVEVDHDHLHRAVGADPVVAAPVELFPTRGVGHRLQQRVLAHREEALRDGGAVVGDRNPHLSGTHDERAPLVDAEIGRDQRGLGLIHDVDDVACRHADDGARAVVRAARQPPQRVHPRLVGRAAVVVAPAAFHLVLGVVRVFRGPFAEHRQPLVRAAACGEHRQADQVELLPVGRAVVWYAPQHRAELGRADRRIGLPVALRLARARAAPPWWFGADQRRRGGEEGGDLVLRHRRQGRARHRRQRPRTPAQIDAGRVPPVRVELLATPQHLHLAARTGDVPLRRLACGRAVHQPPPAALSRQRTGAGPNIPVAIASSRSASAGSSTSRSIARRPSARTPVLAASGRTGATAASGGLRRARACQAPPNGRLSSV